MSERLTTDGECPVCGTAIDLNTQLRAHHDKVLEAIHAVPSLGASHPHLTGYIAYAQVIEALNAIAPQGGTNA